MKALRILTLASAFVVTLGVVPATTLAYLAPEQVFQGLEPPPARRETEDVVRDRQKDAAAERDAAHEGLPSTEDVPESEEELMPAAPVDPNAEVEDPRSLLDDEGVWDRRQERLNEGGNGGTTIIINGDGGQVIRDRQTGEVLHSGAPRMTGTGPAEWLAAFVLFAASTATFFWAHKREQKLGLPR